MALDFVETCNEDTILASFLPSIRAVAAVTLARMALHIEPSWSHQLESVSRFTAEEVRPCIVAAIQCVWTGSEDGSKTAKTHVEGGVVYVMVIV